MKRRKHGWNPPINREEKRAIVNPAGLIVLLVLLIMLIPAWADAYIQTFDSDNAGWTGYRINSTGYIWGTPVVNGGGYLSADVTGSADNRLYSFEVSGTAVGSLTGETLTVAYRSVGEITGPSGPNVRFYIADMSGHNYFFSNGWDANTDGNWTTLEVLINEANFIPWYKNDGITTFAQIAANPGWIGLAFTNGDFSMNDNLGFTSEGGAVVSIDNFGFPTPDTVPIPAAFWFMSVGLAGLVGAGRIVNSRRRVRVSK
ncbi:MAG: hypothetical protein A4E57_00650 [Syntrophorhabdaceae bacterium PtaU1.Bin034]|nr:MAG: hypothetical protein A4E57_00650 [Syntrophorhabdaceae bacterium PtaU1.Bin034]